MWHYTTRCTHAICHRLRVLNCCYWLLRSTTRSSVALAHLRRPKGRSRDCSVVMVDHAAPNISDFVHLDGGRPADDISCFHCVVGIHRRSSCLLVGRKAGVCALRACDAAVLVASHVPCVRGTCRSPGRCIVILGTSIVKSFPCPTASAAAAAAATAVSGGGRTRHYCRMYSSLVQLHTNHNIIRTYRVQRREGLYSLFTH